MKMAVKVVCEGIVIWGLSFICLAPIQCSAAVEFTENEPPFLNLGIGVGGLFDEHQDPLVSLEYRPAIRFYHVGPWFYFFQSKDEAFYLAAGAFLSISLGERWRLTPKFGGGYYDEQNGFDLGSELEFRSELECSFRFHNEHRVGISLSHLSNASFARWNPGAEIMAITWSIPLDRFKSSTTDEHR
jgi:lipid A 3-O-deacylase